MPLTDAQWTALATDLQAATARTVPQWTDLNPRDPGVRLVQLMAFLVENLLTRRHPLSARARLDAMRLSTHAAALAESAAGDSGSGCPPGLQRVNFFAGLVLGADDLQTLQDYARERLNRRNRLLHGMGIAQGLEVSVQHDAGGSRVVLAPGLAFDALGNEIFVEQPLHLPLPADGRVLLLLLRYSEVPCRPVPAAAFDAAGPEAPVDEPPAAQPSRIAETWQAELADVPVADALALARLRRVRGRWRLDPRLKAPQARP